jgi:DNA-directed RNA polymerase specialized sigma subunit
MHVDELIQVGMVGLIEASRSFDAARGVDFEIFARTRIRGAILDEVRRISVLPRSAISHIRETNEATQELATELGRAPTQ